jgi:hypothetical protein
VFEILPAGWRLIEATKIEAGKPAGVSLQFDQPGHKELLAVISRMEQTDLRTGDIAVPPAAVVSRRIALDIPRPQLCRRVRTGLDSFGPATGIRAVKRGGALHR